MPCSGLQGDSQPALGKHGANGQADEGEDGGSTLSIRGCEVWPQGAARDKRGDIQGMERAVPAEGTGVFHTVSRRGGQQGEKTSQTDTCVRWLAVTSRMFVKLLGH